MDVQPAWAQFRTLYQESQPQIVWTSLPNDLETPISAMLKLAARQGYSFLLESAEGGRQWGRYSVIGIKPDLIWRCRGARAEITRLSRSGRTFTACTQPPLASLRALLQECRIESFPAELPPMAGGLFGYLGYGMVQLMERLPDCNPDPLAIPDAILIRPTLVLIFDNLKHITNLSTAVWPNQDIMPEAAYEQAHHRLTSSARALGRGLRARKPAGLPANLPLGEWDVLSPIPGAVESNLTQAQYCQMVARAKQYIRAGDIFQVVPSQRFTLPFTLAPFALYRSLRRLNPSPFLFYLNLKDFALVGSSPEILVRVRDGMVTVRPIAGTRPRGANPQEDQRLADDLLADLKECAEHLMLLDLGRNDVGRVAQVGSVRVTERMIIEYYSHVMHIVSNVEGKLAPGCEALDALIAGFPAGTVSGAPKIRAMEIIDELESIRRSFYAGCIGYFASNGSMDSCITLRTALIKDKMMYVQAGGGVVADSDPKTEYDESCNKARALFSAARDAIIGA